jgi:YidC/Oxa1 family membrane protein insertase
MDQKRLFIAIAISVAILVVSQVLLPRPAHRAPPPAQVATSQSTAAPSATTPGGQPATAPLPSNTLGVGPQDAGLAPVGPAGEVPRLKFDGPRVSGSISLVGARLDDLVLNDYRETIAKDSPLVRLLEPGQDPQPTSIAFGWSSDGHTKVPDANTLWTVATPGPLTPQHPVTLSWDNGQGQTFEQTFALDHNYMFTVQLRVRNATDAPVTLYPWGRVLRGYTPQTGGYSVLHEGLIGWVGSREQDMTYGTAKSDGEKHDGLAFHGESTGGWVGFTDKYWLSAVIPDQAQDVMVSYRYIPTAKGSYQADFVAAKPLVVPAHGDAMQASRAFVGAKEVHLLNRYQDQDGISHFSYAIDWGWFWFLTKPIYYALDWLYAALGNFGVAILVFTIGVKALFFPLANHSYRSMSKMKLLAPKMQALREQYKDDQAKQQQAMMQLYKTEKVNPASGCLPMLLQIPVFFSLYKVIFINIDMRHAPFFGWIHDLSAVDPTNVFNLFGLIPFDPTMISPFLHLGAWPLIMGITMWAQQKLNPPPPDPTQAKLFQLMPLVFTFMLARFPAGLVIYWTWNNLLTIGQQWLIMRQMRLARPGLARTT